MYMCASFGKDTIKLASGENVPKEVQDVSVPADPGNHKSEDTGSSVPTSISSKPVVDAQPVSQVTEAASAGSGTHKISTEGKSPITGSTESASPSKVGALGETVNGSIGPRLPQKVQGKDMVESSLLKNYTGIKVSGPCGEEIGIFLIPYIYITVQTEIDSIKVATKFPQSDNEILEFKNENDKLSNQCAINESSKFTFIVYIYKGLLTLKWKVHTTISSQNTDKTKADTRTYVMPPMEMPITSIQVHTFLVEGETVFLKSKDYVIKKDMPLKCENVANNCFLSGNTDIEKCYTCSLLIKDVDTSDVCFNYVSSEFKERLEEIKIKGQDDDQSDEYELTETIDNILKGIYKTDSKGNKELIHWEDVDAALKEELTKYCMLLKGLDTSGMLDYFHLGNEIDVFNNLSKFLKKHKEEKHFLLKKKLKNAVMCIKSVDEWVKNKTGFVLPQLSYSILDNTNGQQQSDKKEGEFGISNLINETKDINDLHPPITDMFCNAEYCDRWKDKNGCFSKIGASDQGNCATSWIFASKMHLETIKCMKGYDHVSSSALYVANCSEKDVKEKCTVGSNPLEFLNIVNGKKFLPSEANLQYSYAKVSDDCPKPKSNWVNLWTGIKLLDYVPTPNSVGTKGYTAYESEKFKVNIVGYGNYISADGKKKSYWIVRNSWGENWGDNGNFKVDMDTPAECKHNFVHTAAVFNLDLPIVEKPAKNGVVNNGSVSAQSDSVYGQATEQTQASPTSEAAQVLELGGARGVLGGDTSTELNQGESSGGKSLELSKDASGAPSGGALTGETSTGGASVAQDGAGTSEKEESASDPKKVEVVHILKYIKNNKIQSSLIKYDYEYGLGDHACSRSHAIDPEKQDECISFCNDKWDDCKRTISPGYCLTKLKGTNECIFCFV
ncbi:serine-repeat antigen, putative [Plasmodium ovale]|uniref:Serine-repeat antigen, putative n=1 Tax=Plasmodium ovale TaxID=36330 RepID=A0A1D3RDY9_PLAOA|nr:serine-repeat antigen, putative [Plasmodium ovale]